MGQGQSDIAMQLLRECSQNGEWLCLKNLHLVTAWLPQLEKVCYLYEAFRKFKLNFTVHLFVAHVINQCINFSRK